MTPEEALLRIGESTGAAVATALAAYCPDAVECAPPILVDTDTDPVAGVPLPAVLADVSYVDGVRGGNLFLMPLPAVRALAAAMMGADPQEAVAAGEGDELSELELSAAGEVANQMMAAAAAGMSTVLGQEVEIAAPETRVIAAAAEALAAVDSATAVVSVAIDVLGHRCRLVQLVPHAFVVRMTRALDDLDAEFPAADDDVAAPGEEREAAVPADLLGDVGVRISAELGRVNMTIRRAVGLAPGAVVELDRELEDPIDLYVNGRRLGTGRLVTLDGDEWAVRIDTVAFETAPEKGD
ncbi:MAG: flagellar motor switch protein FliN [Solirubrobacteraceae bacterium]|jgi:flagellar motor switch protein FliN/FliY|nr:flagellar motor switch protein FliN [Solirubrobacteraceae bacterium]